MTVNPRIGCYQVVARNSRGDAAIYPSHDIPDGWEVIQVGPDRDYLLAQLATMGQLAATLLGNRGTIR